MNMDGRSPSNFTNNFLLTNVFTADLDTFGSFQPNTLVDAVQRAWNQGSSRDFIWYISYNQYLLLFPWLWYDWFEIIPLSTYESWLCPAVNYVKMTIGKCPGNYSTYMFVKTDSN